MKYLVEISGDVELDVIEESPPHRLEIEDIVQSALQIALSTDGFARLLVQQMGEELSPPMRSYKLRVGSVRSESRPRSET